MVTKPAPKTETSPKVWAAGTTIVVSALVLTLTQQITPELFDFLGSWAPVAYAVAVAGLGAFAGWWKTDPLRSVGAVIRDAHGEEGVVEFEAGTITENEDGTVTVAPPADRVPGPDHRA